ncbi:MAG: DUF4340 domain-containing protein [Spirochaetaceae bacterium]|nr:MAG: DUF4340 domain-containing protein [Spirochaetaceae bacterium]
MTYRVRVLLLSLAIGVLALTWLVGMTGRGRRSAPPGAGIPLVAPGALPAVTTVEIDGAEAIRLERDRVENGRWWITLDGRALPARGSRIEEFLQTLGEQQTESRVAVSAAGWPQFGVDDPILVRLFDPVGRDVAELFFGRRSDAGRGGYLRFDTGQEVYRVGDAPFFAIERSAVYWSDLRLLPPGLTEDRVAAVRIRSDIAAINDLSRRFTYALVRGSGGEWIVDGPAGRVPAHATRARELITAILTLEGSRFAASGSPTTDGPRDTGVDSTVTDPRLTTVDRAVIEVELFDGRRASLTIDAYGERLWIQPSGVLAPVDGDGRPVAFEFAPWSAERVLRPVEDLVQ